MLNSEYSKKQTYRILLLSLLLLLPQYFIRRDLDIMYWMYDKFTTYFGDVWYCWNNYLHNNFPYPREYPAGLQVLFRLIYLLPGLKEDYSYYANVMFAIFAVMIVCSTLVLLKLNVSRRNLFIFWLFSPSYLFYIFWNLDIFPILTMFLAYYFYRDKNLVASALFLALGTTLKVFPIFLLPLYFLAAQDMQGKIRVAIAFVASWIAFNVPLMYMDWGAWIFPYVWQIQSNYSRSMQDGSWTWLLYVFLDQYGYGAWVGKISLVLFAGGYLMLITKYRNLSFEAKIVVVMLLFLLTDRVYSPQYDLYLLAALVFFTGRVKLWWFYLLELPNFIQCLFTFWLKNHAYWLQLILVVKYLAIIMLLLEVLRNKPMLKSDKT